MGKTSLGLCVTSVGWHWVAAMFIFCYIAAAAGRACVQGQELLSSPAEKKITWKTGGELAKQLQTEVGLKWAETPLRPVMLRLGGNVGVCLFLDRRIDPDQKLDFSASATPLAAVIATVAEKIKMGSCQIGPVTYLGPSRTVSRLPTIAAQKRKSVAELSGGAKNSWTRPKAYQWEELSQPRELVLELAKEGGVRVENPEQVPYDLWPACDLAPLPLADRLTLVLAGFDFTYELAADGGSLRIIAFPSDPVYEHVYVAKGDAAKLAADLKRTLPDIRIERQGSKLMVTARFEDHDKIERLLRGEQVKTSSKAATGTKRFTLTVTRQPAGAVLNTVAKDVGKELKYPPELRDKLRQQVSLSVKDVTLQELLTKTLEPLGLACTVTEKTLEITPQSE